METSKKRIVVTGGGGRISRAFAGLYGDRYDLVLLDRKELADPPVQARSIVGDICDADTVAGAVEGADVVVHLAGDASTRASWESALQNNIIGARTVFDAAYQAGVSRIVFASSSHASGAYVHEFGSTGPGAPMRPDSIYGVSKVFGEALGSYYADRLGMSVICLRIGACFGPDTDETLRPWFEQLLTREMAFPYKNWQNLSIWISRRDVAQLIMRSIETDAHFGVFYGTSDNHPVVLDLSEARRVLGYDPQDSAERILGRAYGPMG